MKKFINILLIFVSIISFIILFNIEDSKQKNSTIYAENQKYSFKILIPDSVNELNHEASLNNIISIADKYKANLYTTINDSTNNKLIYKKYIYLNDSSYLNNFLTKSNNSLNFSMLDNGHFFATTNKNNENQSETLLDFAGNDFLEIHNLKDISVLAGFYMVNLDNISDKDNFIKDLSNSLNISISEPEKSVVDINYDWFGIIIVIFLYLLTIVLIVYDILNSYKKIGIFKLLGRDNKSIWLSYIVPLASKVFIFFIVTSSILIPFYFKNVNKLLLLFIFKLLLVSLLLSIISFALLSIPFLLLKKFTLTSILKNNRPNKSILIINNIVKIIVSIICISILVTSFNNYNRIKSFYDKNYSSWEKTKDYVILPNIVDSDEKLDQDDNYTLINKKLYFAFNKNGSILANFKYYSKTYTDRTASSASSYSKPYDRYSMINPNYLTENPIYDVNNNKVNISENEKNIILLVPEMYSNIKDEILESAYNYFYEAYKLNDSQTINIIWTANNQEAFSYNLDVNPDEGNMVKNPFCFVITENNCNDRAYAQVLGYTSDPFKIKINNSNSIDEDIRPVLINLDINKNVPDIVPIYTSISSEIDYINKYLNVLAGIFLILVLLLLFITVQNVANYYEQNKLKFSIKKMYGYSIKDNYGGFYKISGITYLIISFISILVSKLDLKTIIVVISVSTILLLIECIVSLLAFRNIQNKNIVSISKGGR